MYTYNTVSRKPNRASSSSACRSGRSRSFWAYVPSPTPISLSRPGSHRIERETYTHIYIYIARPSKANHIITTRPHAQQLFNGLVDHCFVSCVDDFSSKALSGRETGCVSRCVQKYMAMSQRLSERFQEHNAQLQQQQQQR